MKEIRNKNLQFKTYDEYDEFCKDKDIQNCVITVDEKLSDEELAKRYKSLLINMKTGELINELPTPSTPSTEQDLREGFKSFVMNKTTIPYLQNLNIERDIKEITDFWLSLLKQEKVRWENDELTDEELENSSWYKAKKLMWVEDLKQELFPDNKTDMASYGWIINVLDGLISNLSK